jgi:hypothetical protein
VSGNESHPEDSHEERRAADGGCVLVGAGADRRKIFEVMYRPPGQITSEQKG